MWNINTCGDEVALCVDCDDPCASSQPSSYCSGEEFANIVFSCSSSGSSFDPSCPEPSGLVNVFSIEYEPISAAPGVLSVAVVNKTSDTMSISIATDASGMIYCIALSNNEKPTSVEQVVSEGSASEIDSSNIGSVTVSGLLGLEDYGIFCAAESVKGTFSSLSAVLETEVHEVSACCKKVFVATDFSKVVVRGDAMDDFMWLFVEQRPATFVSVMVTIFSNDSDISANIFPSRIVTFTSAVEGKVFLSMPSDYLSGVYSIEVNVTHDLSGEYAVDTIGGDGAEFEVVSPLVKHPPPQAMGARFSANGNAVLIKFNKPTDLGGVAVGSSSFSCGELLTIGSSSSSIPCSWTNKTTLRVSLSGFKSMSVGDEIVVLGNKIKADCVVDDCTQWLYMNESSLLVSLPTTVTVPRLSLQAPRFLGACNDMYVDISASSGSLGRNWSSVEFSLISSSDATATAPRLVTLLNSFLSSDYRKPVKVPRDANYLGLSHDYTLLTKICNFMMGCAQKTWKVTVLSTAAPTVSISGPQRRSIHRRSSLLLNAQAFSTVCSTGLKSKENITYTWALYGPDGRALNLASTSKSPSNFRAPPYTFDVGLYYTVTVTAFHTVDRVSSTASVVVGIAPASVVAAVSGRVGLVDLYSSENPWSWMRRTVMTEKRR
mgnify:FL=1